ncbi:MAG: S41 family peptidase [Coriobacteriales bacterium]|nr:S41 family peptidase [Coriobacteriales bacterium]
MKIDEFYNKLYFTGADKYPEKAKQMAVTHNGSVYEAPAYDGTKATFDVDADTFACENLDAYTMAPYYTLFLAEQADPSAPFVRVSSTDYTGDVTPRTVDLKRYGIDLVADGADLWVPLPTLECIFCCPYAYDVFYNGRGIYVNDGNEVLQKTNARDLDENYYAFMKDERSAEKIAFDYGNLCFYVDTFCGHPACSRLSESIKADGLDKTLDKTIAGMKLPSIKELLKSADMLEYVIGLDCLFGVALDDGGHTGFVDVASVANASQDKLAELQQRVADYGLSKNENTRRGKESLAGLSEVFTQMTEGADFKGEVMEYDDGSGAAVYMEQGDTAMFVVGDHYDIDRAGWTAYESGQSSKMPQDSMGTFMQALDKAKANPQIKNFIVNIAMCGGGEAGTSTTISKFASGQAYRHQFNELSGQDEVVHHDVDANFDGTFDEKDDEVSYPFNFAVVASAQSYSAANYLANMAKDNGVCLLGETTGGGANSPQVTPDPEGLMFNLSARYKLMDKNNQHVDFGVEPDYVLTQEKDGTKDYSQYFDLATISKYVNEYYAK